MWTFLFVNVPVSLTYTTDSLKYSITSEDSLNMYFVYPLYGIVYCVYSVFFEGKLM